MLILTDNDVIGAVRAFRRILESSEWVGLTTALELRFLEFQDVELTTEAPDSAVWQRSQDIGALLITGNRSSGEGSLDRMIAEQAGPERLPVLTIGDPRRVIRDGLCAGVRNQLAGLCRAYRDVAWHWAAVYPINQADAVMPARIPKDL